MVRLGEHRIRSHLKIGHVKKPADRREGRESRPFFMKKSRFQSKNQRKAKNRPERPPPLVQKIGGADAVHFLAAGHGHDEIDVRNFEQNEAETAEVE